MLMPPSSFCSLKTQCVWMQRIMTTQIKCKPAVSCKPRQTESTGSETITLPAAARECVNPGESVQAFKEHNKPKYNSQKDERVLHWCFSNGYRSEMHLVWGETFVLLDYKWLGSILKLSYYKIKWNNALFFSVLIEVKINNPSSSIRYRFSFNHWNLNH